MSRYAIPTKQEVIDVAKRLGIEEEVAKKFFDYQNKRGWRGYIDNFVPMLQNFISKSSSKKPDFFDELFDGII